VSTPRLEIDLGRLRHNTATLVARLGARGVRVTGVTKATLGSPEVARAMLDGGVAALGDSRIENLERLRSAGIEAHLTLVRSPLPSQVDRVVACANTSLNSEAEVLTALSQAAVRQSRSHSVVLMVELGDLREGVLAADLDALARHVERLPQLVLLGIGTNLACQSGIVPDERNMAELSALAAALEVSIGRPLDVVSGGNSANLGWALGVEDGHGVDGVGASPDLGRIDDLRLGEAILLGVEPLHRRPLAGLHTDAVTLVAEVIESRTKPSRPWGTVAQTAFGDPEPPDGLVGGSRHRALLALGRQDVDPDGLVAPRGVVVRGASSDHLVLDTGDRVLRVGDEVRFGLDYSALVRTMTSPFVAREYREYRDGDTGGPAPA
jgi:ornithine racemase